MMTTETMDAKVALTPDEIDRMVRDVDDEIASVRTRWSNEPTPRGRDELSAQLVRYGAIASIAHTERQIVARLIARVEVFETRRKDLPEAALAKFERAYEGLAERGDPVHESRRRESRAAYAAAIAFVRDGHGSGSTPPGPVIAWCADHRIEEGALPSLPTIDALIASAKRDLEPHRARLAAALRSWEAERTSSAA